MKSIILSITLVLFSCVATAQEAQWRGENRDGIFPDTGLLNYWPEEGPELLTHVEGVGRGFSMPVADRGIIFITGTRDTTEYLSAYELSGKIRYSVPYGPAWSSSYPDARSAPAITGNKAVVISGGGTVACMDKKTGSMYWSVDGFGKFEGRCGDYGIAESPLVVDGRVIYTPGGELTTVVALDLNTGETVWTSESLEDSSAYVSPILVEYAGRKMIVGMTSGYLFGVDAANGSFLWTYNYYNDYPNLDSQLKHEFAVANCVSPVYKDGRIYITSGYDHGGVMLQLNPNGTGVSPLWKDPVLDCHHGGVVLVDGHLYGSNWMPGNKGEWCCIDWETGQTNYVKKWETKGSVVSAENFLYCYEERRGNLALVKATPLDFEIISSFRIPYGTGPHWAHPAIYDGRLIIRHGESLMIFNLSEITTTRSQ